MVKTYRGRGEGVRGDHLDRVEGGEPRGEGALRPTPQTLHLTPYTQHPTPCTLHTYTRLHPTPPMPSHVFAVVEARESAGIISVKLKSERPAEKEARVFCCLSGRVQLFEST